MSRLTASHWRRPKALQESPYMPSVENTRQSRQRAHGTARLSKEALCRMSSYGHTTKTLLSVWVDTRKKKSALTAEDGTEVDW